MPYNLYEISNTINDKVYVGITIQTLKDRFSGHTHLARKGIVHPLYTAMRKHGIDNFSIKIMRDDAIDAKTLQQQEIDEISRRKLCDRDYGYNLYPGGTLGPAKKITVGIQTFQSHSEAALSFGIEPKVFSLRMGRLKWSPEQAAEIENPPNVKRHVILIDGSKISLKSASQRLELNYSTVHLRVKNGWTYHQALELDDPPSGLQLPIKVQVNGQTFKTLAEAARAYGIRPNTVHNRVRYQKCSIEEALCIEYRKVNSRAKGKEITAFGKTYPSRSACARENRLRLSSLSLRLDQYGDDPETAINYLQANT